MNEQSRPLIGLLLLGLVVWLATGRGCDGPAIISTRATAATYVYEKDRTAIPSAVLAALDKLNRERKILATTFDQDTKDGTGDVPEPYKVPLAAAREAGLPALVATNGERVLRVVKDPRTEQQVLEAVP